MKYIFCCKSVFTLSFAVLVCFAYGNEPRNESIGPAAKNGQTSAEKDEAEKEGEEETKRILFIEYKNPDTEKHLLARRLFECRDKMNAHRENPELNRMIDDLTVMENFSIIERYKDDDMLIRCGVKPAVTDIDKAKALIEKCEAYLSIPIPDSERKPGERIVLTVEESQFPFRWCPPGEFMMGSPETETGRKSDETLHRVRISKGFWMLESEVTQQMYQSVMEENPSAFSYSGKYMNTPPENRYLFPAENVRWNDARDFCGKLSQKSEKRISLPTEAQWEYACRAGSDGPYYNGDDLSAIAWYDEWKDDSDSLPMYEINLKSPNAWGLYDMIGHVAEWCADRYGDYSAGSETAVDPAGPALGAFRVIRGGGWGYAADACRSAARGNGETETYKNKNLGFRIVMSLTEE